MDGKSRKRGFRFASSLLTWKHHWYRMKHRTMSAHLESRLVQAFQTGATSVSATTSAEPTPGQFVATFVLVVPNAAPHHEASAMCAHAVLGGEDEPFTVEDIVSVHRLATPDGNFDPENGEWEESGNEYVSCWHAVETNVLVSTSSTDDDDVLSTFRESRRTRLLALASEFKIDLVVVPAREQATSMAGCKEEVDVDHALRLLPRLAVFDMDSTLIRQEVIDELAASAGPEAAAKVAETTERAMRGELDFSESLRERVSALEGLNASEIVPLVRTKIGPSAGAVCLARVLTSARSFDNERKVRTSIVSGGFIPFARHVQTVMGFDYAFANDLVISKDEVFAGKVLDPIVDSHRKRRLLEIMATVDNEKTLNQIVSWPEGSNARGIPFPQGNTAVSPLPQEISEGNSTKRIPRTVACGDGANDLEMMKSAWLSVAFCAKRMVVEQAMTWISTPRLDAYLFYLGLNQDQINTLFVRGSQEYKGWLNTNKDLVNQY